MQCVDLEVENEIWCPTSEQKKPAEKTEHSVVFMLGDAWQKE